VKIKGNKFLDGATVRLTDGDGQEITPTSITRRNAKNFVVHLDPGTVPSGATIVVEVLNPGPAPSTPIQVTAP
jgi:hypothetical protein